MLHVLPATIWQDALPERSPGAAHSFPCRLTVPSCAGGLSSHAALLPRRHIQAHTALVITIQRHNPRHSQGEQGCHELAGSPQLLLQWGEHHRLNLARLPGLLTTTTSCCCTARPAQHCALLLLLLLLLRVEVLV